MKVLCYGHFRSAPVVVDAGYARSENRLHSLQPCRSPRALAGRLLDGIFPLQQLTGHDKSRRSRDMQSAFDPEVRERCRVIPTADRPSGCVGHCATLFWQIALSRSSSEDREDAETSCVQRSIAPQLHALAGCGCRCATLSRWTGSLSWPTAQRDVSRRRLIAKAIFSVSGPLSL